MHDAINAANSVRRFPENTCPASRLVQDIGEALVRGEEHQLLAAEPDTCGESMLAVVTALYRARTRLAELDAEAR